MMTVKEASRLTGISIRTLQYYDKLGLLPAMRTESGYRLYDDAALERLQQILLFRELEFPLRDIRTILDNPNFDRRKALRQQIELLTLKKQHLEDLIRLARTLQVAGGHTMQFKEFDTSRIDEYTRRAKESWGDTPAYREFIEYYHQLGQEGLINLEGFAQTLDQFNANLNADKVGVFWAWGPCNHITDKELFLQFEAFVPPAAEGYETVMYTANLTFANAYRNDFIISKDCKNIEKAYEIWEYASDPVKALEICNGSHRGIFWDENNEYLPADATIEDIAANGFHYLGKEFDKECPEGCTHEQDAALTAAGYEWCIGKTYTGSNTLGLVDIAPLMLESESYRTNDLSRWGVQRYVSLDKYDPTFCPYFMNLNIVPAEAQEELDFSTDGLYNIINGFFADAVMKKGVTDESWNSYLADLENYGYNYYVDFYNKLAHNEL